MKTSEKRFECVEMKRRIQADIWNEYQAHHAEHPSFADFVRSRTARSEWVRELRETRLVRSDRQSA